LLSIGGASLLERQLALVSDVEDVRIVVGFEKERVIAAARQIRGDIIFCINSAYRTTATADSYDLGARGLKDWCLFMDADILFDPLSFARFLGSCLAGERRIAVTSTKTENAVFVDRTEDGWVTGFSRSSRSDYEWANVAWLPSDHFSGYSGDVFRRIAYELPVASGVIQSFEVDTQSDLELAQQAILGELARNAT
jgi:choline kinase